MLNHLIQLLDRLVHLVRAGGLLAAGGADFLDQFACALDVGHDGGQHPTGLFRHGEAGCGELSDFTGRRAAAFSKLAQPRRPQRRSPCRVRRTCGFNSRVQRKQVGLARDFFDEAYLFDYLAHGVHGSGYSVAALLGVFSAFAGKAFGLHGVVGVLTDVCSHFFDA